MQVLPIHVLSQKGVKIILSIMVSRGNSPEERDQRGGKWVIGKAKWNPGARWIVTFFPAPRGGPSAGISNPWGKRGCPVTGWKGAACQPNAAPMSQELEQETECCWGVCVEYSFSWTRNPAQFRVKYIPWGWVYYRGLSITRTAENSVFWVHYVSGALFSTGDTDMMRS